MYKVGLLFIAILLSLTACGANEIDSCNSDRVKRVLMDNTFLKSIKFHRDAREKTLATPFRKLPPDYSRCRPGPLMGRVFSNNNAPTQEPVGSEQCRKGVRDEIEAANEYAEAGYRSQQKKSSGLLNLLNKVEANIVNIRQQNYDRPNNVRYCVAEFEYQNLPTELRKGIEINSNFMACRKLIAYKIEPLQDKPDSFYVSWQCQ